MKPAVNTLGTGQQLQHQYFTEQRGVLSHSAGSGLTSHTNANSRANTSHQCSQDAAQQGKEDTQNVPIKSVHFIFPP